ncbi:MAG: hypothetical protein N4A40_13295 [Tissierellales bacterium]|nr:hypothetical protein [Tissierellales bacterium]
MINKKGSYILETILYSALILVVLVLKFRNPVMNAVGMTNENYVKINNTDIERMKYDE